MSQAETLNASETQMQFYDEMRDADGNIRPEYQLLLDWIDQQDADCLSQLNAAADQQFLKKGITFTVYSDASNIERTIPFDVIPRIIAQREWRILEAGCQQRVRALNAFLHDIYHEQNIIEAGIVPADQIMANPCFQPWMMDHDLHGQIYAHISGVDLIRHGDGQYYVLEDNLRTPSGVSYMLEGRRISQEMLKAPFSGLSIEQVAHYPALLKQCLIESSPVDEPQIVVLTPGRFNSAYYEHAFLAREMGVPLVNGYDLYVQGMYVYVRTAQGPRRVDVIYRRVDDDFIDPLAFRADSTLGVAGLMAAYRNHQVVIANAPGTGVADDKSVYPYVDRMIQFYLNEDPILHNVPTWQCRKPQDLEYVLDHLEELVVKEAQGSGGYGMLIGPKATPSEREEFHRRLRERPDAYIAQPTLALSTCPTLVEEGIAPRHIDLRPFVLASPKQIRIVPGGLTRVALTKGSLVVNSSQGGGVKDTWVLGASA